MENRQRLIEIWSAWQRAYREPVDGWTGAEDFRLFFEEQRDAVERRVRRGRAASLLSDAQALRRFVAAGGDLRLAIRGVDNMAEARAVLLGDLDVLIDDLQTSGVKGDGVMQQINLRVSEDLLGAIDELRGNVSRERFMRCVLQRHVDYYRDDASFDAREYVDGQLGLRERDRVIATALDERRGTTSRVAYMTEIVEAALDVGNTGNTGNSVTTR